MCPLLKIAAGQEQIDAKTAELADTDEENAQRCWAELRMQSLGLRIKTPSLNDITILGDSEPISIFRKIQIG